MKKIMLLLMMAVAINTTYSQGISINSNGQTADPSAMLDISSHDKGVLIPRLRSGERTSIAAPAFGLLVYDIDTKSFWYYDQGIWKEILNSSSQVLPMGPASGDLYGSYPSPNVGKIQNLDIAFGVPFDKQALKWDMLNNRWQGQNDSLFLPYNVTFGNPTKLFGITNSNTTTGATAVYGKSGAAGSGISPALTIGVWGDNAAGAGVLGTSNNGTGVYGYSINNNGLYGFTSSPAFAGIYGSRINNGTAIFADLYSGGAAFLGKSNGTSGKAAWLEVNNAANPDTALGIVHNGIGRGLYLSMNNTLNTTEAFSIFNAGKGQSMNIYTNNTASTATMLYASHAGTGVGFSMNIPNTLNNLPAVQVQHFGTGSGIESFGYKGKAGFFSIPAATNASTALSATTLGTGQAGDFSISNSSNSDQALRVSTIGTGRALEAVISNAASLAAAVYGSSSGSKGVQGIAQVQGVTGQSTGLTGGIGVYGLSSLNSANGIGVRAESYSTGANSSSGALTAINNSDGTAVYADATGGGIAVYGVASRINGPAIYAINSAAQGQALRGSATGTDGIGIYSESGNSSSSSIAAYFRNNYVSNNRNVVQVVTNGTGKALSIQNTNSGNNNEMLRIQNAGSAEYLLCVDEQLNTKAYIAKNGNINTDGTVTVNGNKGIVRSSTSTQLRIETMTVNLPSGSISHYDEFNTSIVINISFSTAFSSAPAVYLGNYIVENGLRNISYTINSVTATGCVLEYFNRTPYDFTFSTGSVKVIAIGAE
jgi:hypothetical protein